MIFLDELPILINRLLKGDEFKITPARRKNTDVFMSWIREISIRHKGSIRIVMTGSIGIEPTLRQANLSATLSTFTPFELLPWTEDAAKSCIVALSNQYEIAMEPDAISRIMEKLGYFIPHHIQMFFDNIYIDWKRREYDVVTPQHVDRVYDKQMLSIRGHAELSHMEERLKMAFGLVIYPVALEILTETAMKGYLDGESAIAICGTVDDPEIKPEPLLREILEILQHDGYLEQKGSRFTFISHLLKDWWERRFGFGYIPILERSV